MAWRLFARSGTIGALRATAAVVALAGGYGAAHAQDETAAQDATTPQAAGTEMHTGVAPIVVTARRVDENLQDIPISVGLLTEDDLDARDIADFQDLQGAIVGVTTSRTATTGGGYVTIRGLTPVATPQPASDQGVGFFIDGVAIARSQGSGAPLVDVARVEVLRGPQGTLFGRNSSFGSINFVTNRPVDRLAASASMEVGNYDAFRAEAMLNIPIAQGLIARFAYRHEEIDGDVKNTTDSPGFNYVEPFGAFEPNETFGAQNADSYLAKLLYEGIDGLSLEYKYDRQEVVAASLSGQQIGFAPTSPLLGLLATIYPFQDPADVQQSFERLDAISADHAGAGTIENDGHMLTADLDINDNLSARSITAYRTTKSDSAADLDGNSWLFPEGIIPGASGPLCVSCSMNVMDQHAWSQEAQLIGNYDDLGFTLGAYYFDEHARFQNTYSVFAFVPFAPTLYTPTQGAAVPPLGTPGDQVLGNDGIYDNRSIAAYGHLDYAFSPAFDISLGLRYTWDDRSTNDLRPDGAGLTEYDDSRLTYDASANFHLDDTKMMFLKYARGYTSGGVDSAVVFRPEITDQVEAGFKGEFLDRRVRLNASAYHTWVKDRQSTVPNTSSGANCSPVLIAAGFTPGNCPVGLFVYNLPGTTKIKGFEIETVVNPVEGLTLSANYSYNDPDFSTGELHRAPKTNLAFSAQYDFPSFDNGSYVTMRADGDYRGGFYATGGNVDGAFVGTVPEVLRGGLTNDEYLARLRDASISGDYWLVNARVTLADIPFGRTHGEITAFVRNLTDTRDPYFTVNYGATFNAAFERPRTYGLRLAVRY